MKKRFIPALIWGLLSSYALYAQVGKRSYMSTVSNNGNHYGHSWLLCGNSGTDTSKNFIGTRDAQPLLFKVNNTKAGYIDYSNSHQNTGFGYLTLNANMVSDADHFGVLNSAFGWGALSSNTTGFENTAHGAGSLFSNTTGAGNTGTGLFSLVSNTTGSLSTATGAYALVSNTTGGNNTASGAWALASNTTGYSNVANGTPFTLAFNTEGSENTATGAVSMINNLTGNANVAYGSFSLAANTTGNNNTALGYAADVAADNLTNSTVIGNGALVDASNKVQVGNTDVTSIGGQVGWTSFSDERIKDNIKENVPGIEFIKALHPVTYHFNVAKENALLGVKDRNTNNITMPQLKGIKLPNGKDMKMPALNDITNRQTQVVADDDKDIEKIQFTGFLAQDVDKAAKSIGYDFSGVDKSGKIWGLRYSEFVVPIVKAVQELSKMNDEKDAKIDGLKKQINELKSMITGSTKSITISDASLEQNSPNPFSNSSSIGYKIPADAKNAQLVITDNSGKTVRQITLNAGKGVANIDASSLSSGTYNYSLLIDGKLIQSKKMIKAN